MSYPEAVHLITQFEGCKLSSYPDAQGKWAIGYGTTTNITEGMTCTMYEAIAMMAKDVETCANEILKMCPVPLNRNEMGALISLSYNIGLPALQHSSLLHKLLIGAPRFDVGEEFLKWDHADGKILPGLVRRRKFERDLFLSPYLPVGDKVVDLDASSKVNCF